jgi:hypothetical protein
LAKDGRAQLQQGAGRPLGGTSAPQLWLDAGNGHPEQVAVGTLSKFEILLPFLIFHKLFWNILIFVNIFKNKNW